MNAQPQRRSAPLAHNLSFWRISGRPGPDDRPPMAAGHPTAWAVLTEHTVLDGSPYPYPVFDTCA